MPDLAATTSQKQSTDRRRHHRASFERLVRYETQWGVLTATVPELSETGLRLETPWLPPLDAEMAIDLHLADRAGKINKYLLRGRVVRQYGETEVGVAFEQMLPLHMLQLRDYVYRADPYFG